MAEIRASFVLLPDVHQGEAAVCRPRLKLLPRLHQEPPPADLHQQKGLQAGLESPCRPQDQVLPAVNLGIIYKYCLNHGEHIGESCDFRPFYIMVNYAYTCLVSIMQCILSAMVTTSIDNIFALKFILLLLYL